MKIRPVYIFSSLFVALSFVALGAIMKTLSAETCGDVNEYVDNESLRRSVVDWADKEILQRKFIPINFKIGHLSGPGDRTATLNLERLGIGIPKWLEGHEVRVVGGRDKPVRLIYVAMGRYKGILVASDNIGSLQGNPAFDLEKIHYSGRVGAVCYIDDEDRHTEK